MCLGEGYQNFFSNQYEFCSYKNVYAKITCQFWVLLLAIAMSNVIDTYCMKSCADSINAQTKEAKKMISKQDHIKRKRYSCSCDLTISSQNCSIGG